MLPPTKIAVLQGHSSRVLFMAMSPNGEKVVTGAGDESLRFWDVFPKIEAIKPQNSFRKKSNSNLFDGIDCMNFGLPN